MDAQVPRSAIDASQSVLALGSMGCLSCPWDRQDNWESTQKLLAWVRISSGLDMRQTKEDEVGVLGSMASTVIGIGQNCLSRVLWDVTEHKFHCTYT